MVTKQCSTERGISRNRTRRDNWRASSMAQLRRRGDEKANEPSFTGPAPGRWPRATRSALAARARSLRSLTSPGPPRARSCGSSRRLARLPTPLHCLVSALLFVTPFAVVPSPAKARLAATRAGIRPSTRALWRPARFIHALFGHYRMTGVAGENKGAPLRPPLRGSTSAWKFSNQFPTIVHSDCIAF